MMIGDQDDHCGVIIIIVSSYSSVSMTLWALRRGRAVRRMSSGSRCVGWAFGLAFAIRTMRSGMVMMMRTIFFFFLQTFDIISESCAVQSNASSNYALTWMFILWLELLWFPSDFVHLNVFSQMLQGIETPSKWFCDFSDCNSYLLSHKGCTYIVDCRIGFSLKFFLPLAHHLRSDCISQLFCILMTDDNKNDQDDHGQLWHP